MGKKINFILIIILMFTTLFIINIFIKENSFNAHNQNESIIDEETNEVIKLEDLKFDDGVVIKEFKEFEDGYLAIGKKDNSPYMQIIRNMENNLVLDKSTNFNKIDGEIIDIIDNKYYMTAIISKGEITTVQEFFVSDNSIIPFYKKQLNINYSKGVKIQPKYFVIHETANTKPGADAEAHYNYWSTNSNANASTHFVIDSNEIYQMLELDQMAWHVGDNKGYSDILNSNSIGIEIAVNSDGDYEKTRQNAIQLTIKIMKQLNMNINQLKKHNDASGKLDPITMLDNPELWTDFVKQVEKGLQ